METIQATCVVLQGKGVLLCGPPGSGKSDLALRLIDAGALLVSDDLITITASDKTLTARFPDAPQNLRGVIEVRGMGLIKVPHQAKTQIDLVIDLSDKIERMPHVMTRSMAGIKIETVTLNPFEASAPAKIRMALLHERVEL
jgi:serine kinase of HPr protein (carbohydrate metabolism regulator)